MYWIKKALVREDNGNVSVKEEDFEDTTYLNVLLNSLAWYISKPKFPNVIMKL